jgi:hypothetical protein
MPGYGRLVSLKHGGGAGFGLLIFNRERHETHEHRTKSIQQL